MFGRIKRSWAYLFGALFVAFFLLAVYPESLLAADSRIAGSDIYKTAVKISEEGWQKADYAVLVRGDDFADALCAGPLARKYNAPILFTPRYRLGPTVLDELERLKVKKVIIIGGYGAISRNIDSQLRNEGIRDIERIYGENRYETSVKIAQRLGSRNIALCTGEDYADALSVSAIAALKGWAILLTYPKDLPAAVEQHLRNYRIENTYLIGGINAISANIASQIPYTERFAGANRYATNRLIIDHFAKDLDFTKVYTAPGEGPNNYVYALAGVPLAAQTSSPLLLNSSTLPAETAVLLTRHLKVASEIIALGDEDVVPSRVLRQYEQCYEQVLRSVFDQEGVYGPANGVTTIDGNLVITAEDVTVQNTVIEGDLLISERIKDGKVFLKNVIVKGRLTIRGGWDSRITGTNLVAASVVIDTKRRDAVEFLLEDKSRIGVVQLRSNAILDDSECSSEGFMNVDIVRAEDVRLEGDFNTVNFSAGGVDIRCRAADIRTLNARSGGDIWGYGSIGTANIGSDGVTLDIIPGTANIAEDCRAYIGGKRFTAGTYKASEITERLNDPIDNLRAFPGDKEVRFTFSRPSGATSVVLKVSDDKGRTWKNANTGTLNKDSTSATATGLTNGVEYYFKLVVTGGTRAGDSNVVRATPSEP